jgi:DNA-directed RNA polymerase specialized sigma24 family protein
MPPRRKNHVLSPEEFDRLLNWLDSDRERAGEIYEEIRWRLIAILAARECPVPEELADETIDRVARRVSDIADNYSGDKILYFFGVLNNVHHEYLKKPATPQPPPVIQIAEIREATHECLERCLGRLPEDARKLIRDYYAEDKQAKIDLRKRLASEMGVSINTLRLRVLRIRESLQKCIERCLAAKNNF